MLLDDERTTIAPKSVTRYRRGDIPGQAERGEREVRQMGTKYRQRASRTQEQPYRSTRQMRSDVYDDAPTYNTYDTADDAQITPSARGNRATRRATERGMVPYGQRDQEREPRQKHPLLYIGIGMCSLLIAWILGLNAYVWFVNTYADPLAYTQTAHRDTVIVVDQGHQEQAHAFVDQHNHIDLVIVPDGDVSKAHIIEGPSLLSDSPQHITLTLTTHGTAITVDAQGPLEVDFLGTNRPNSIEWTTDVNGKQPAK